MTEIARSCPKCFHVRGAADNAPAWQCPACGIAYDKYAAYLESLRHLRALGVPPVAGSPLPRIVLDGSVWSLVAANVLTLAIALCQQWGLGPLMLLYWGQSVVIGVSNVFRILALDKFSTENFRMNNRPVKPTAGTKVQVAAFFAIHYGLFHVVYFVFLFVDRRSGIELDLWFWACTAAFALNHLWSYRYNRDLDRKGTPNIGTLMFTPYLRIVPMHLTIILGGMAGGGTVALLLFGLLKTLADVGMHLVEHVQLQKVRGASATGS